MIRLLSDLQRLWRELKDELRDALHEARHEYRHRKRQMDNSGIEPVSDDEAAEIVDWYRSLARPALILRPGAGMSVADAPAQIGGPVWLADGEQWPLDAAGQRLEFVAQLNFDRLPKLAGFPVSGILRFFVGRDELFGANWDVPEQSGCRILWHPGPVEGGRREPAAPLSPDAMSPFESETLRDEGQALSATAASDLPDADSCQVEARLAGQSDRLGMSDLEDEIFAIGEQREQGHRIGGYPMFTQPDFRRAGYYDDYDTLLLGLTSDEAIMWGDVGEAVFLMRQSDLDRRDFSRVVFYWDCH